MIRIIDRTNSDIYAGSMDQLFRLRHTCFVKERGWHQFDKDGIYEQDQYDNDDAIYMASIDANDAVIGCMRLYPTTQPHMLGEHFSHLVKGPVPSGDTIIEMTRMAIAENRRGKQIYCEILIGLQELCLARGISNVTGLIRWLRMPIVLATGYKLTQLGDVQEMDNDPVIAVSFDVSEAILDKIKRYAGITHSVLENADIGLRKIV